MAYINFPVAAAKGLTVFDIIILQLIYQNRMEDHSVVLEQVCSNFDKFDAQNLTTYIKKKKKTDTIYNLVRLSNKGIKVLDEIQIPEINEDDLKVYEWLELVYKRSGKEVGNAKKTKMLIALFRAHSGLERNHLALLCKKFISDEREMEWSMKLEYLFFKPATVYQVKFDIDQSRLFQYYLKHKEFFDEEFKKIEN